MLISESYRHLNGLLHRSNPSYGTSGHRYLVPAWQTIEHYETTDILDYGCGKRTLEVALGFSIANYDPALEGWDKAPEPHDIVICTDVLEHIEPDCLEDVLKDIRRCTKKACFLVVATRAAEKTLADGRNAHLIQQPYDWWKECFVQANLDVKQISETKGEFGVVCE